MNNIYKIYNETKEEFINKIDRKYLPLIINDECWPIRLRIARRIDIKYLPLMMKDEFRPVREEAIRRIK